MERGIRTTSDSTHPPHSAPGVLQKYFEDVPVRWSLCQSVLALKEPYQLGV